MRLVLNAVKRQRACMKIAKGERQTAWEQWKSSGERDDG